MSTNLTVHISDVPHGTTDEAMKTALSSFGEISEIRMPKNRRRFSLYAFVIFSKKQGYDACIAAGEVTIGTTKCKCEPAKEPTQRRRDTLFIRGIPTAVTDDDLIGVFKEFHPIKTRIVCHDQQDRKGFAFIQFATEEEQSNAFQARRQFDLKGGRSFVRYAITDINADFSRFQA